MSKIVAMKKKLLRETAILFGVLALTGGAVFALDYYLSSKAAEGSKLKSSVQALNGQISEIEKKINLVQSSVEIYTKLKSEMDARRYATDREQARAVIDQMRQEYRLSNLKIEISPETPFSAAQTSQFTTLEPTYRDLKITFGAITDLHVYAFLEELPKRVSGFLKVSGISIHRNKPITDEVLSNVSKGDEPELVNAELHFVWTGIREKSKTPAGAPHAP